MSDPIGNTRKLPPTVLETAQKAEGGIGNTTAGPMSDRTRSKRTKAAAKDLAEMKADTTTFSIGDVFDTIDQPLPSDSETETESENENENKSEKLKAVTKKKSTPSVNPSAPWKTNQPTEDDILASVEDPDESINGENDSEISDIESIASVQKRRSSRHIASPLDILVKAADKFSSENREDPKLVEINSMKVADLKSELKLRHLPIKGNKSDLMNRLVEAYKAAAKSKKRSAGNSSEQAAANKVAKVAKRSTGKARATKSDGPKKNRRHGSDPPRSQCSCKDKASREHFVHCTGFIKKLQNSTTWRDEHERKTNPKSQHFMLSFDKVVPRPYLTSGSKQRVEPISVFLVPDLGFDVKKFGSHLITLGKQMLKESGEGYACTKDADEYYGLIFEE